MHEWNRQQLWPTRPTPETRRERVWVVMCTAGVMALVVGLVGASMSCLELYYAEDAGRSPGIVAPDECYSDEECALRPAQITCCGECEAVPPFEAVARTTLLELRANTDESCAPTTRLCDPPVCAPLPAGCEVRAVCRGGSCRAEATALCTYQRP